MHVLVLKLVTPNSSYRISKSEKMYTQIPSLAVFHFFKRALCISKGGDGCYHASMKL